MAVMKILLKKISILGMMLFIFYW